MNVNIDININAKYTFQVKYTSTMKYKDVNNHYMLDMLKNFGQQGREMVTFDVDLILLNALFGEYHLGGLDKSTLNHILQKLIIKIVPMENLNGGYNC